MEIPCFQAAFLSFLSVFKASDCGFGLHITFAGKNDAADVVHLALVVALGSGKTNGDLQKHLGGVRT